MKAAEVVTLVQSVLSEMSVNEQREFADAILKGQSLRPHIVRAVNKGADRKRRGSCAVVDDLMEILMGKR